MRAVMRTNMQNNPKDSTTAECSRRSVRAYVPSVYRGLRGHAVAPETPFVLGYAGHVSACVSACRGVTLAPPTALPQYR